ncbi:hypothetical protein AAF712_010303 [Marasmius tenuissimus]|uniref:Uncharacterized protein n=1 Tax=Marasmius tenuissimus TaxID=585030 RepID=A0ABR2ZR39_9AGAR
MFRVRLLIFFLAQRCACFRISAPPTITVGVAATAIWTHDFKDGVTQIYLVQDEPEHYETSILDGQALQQDSGSVQFVVQGPGKYRLEGFGENKQHDNPGVGPGRPNGPQGPPGMGSSGDVRAVESSGTTPSSAAHYSTAMIVGSVLGVLLFFTLLAIFLYFCRRRRAEGRIIRGDAGLPASFYSNRMVIFDRPWYQSPAYSFPRPWARSSYAESEFTSTSESESRTQTYTSSDLSFSPIAPSDSVSQLGHPSKEYKFQIKRKPLRTSTDLSTVPESQGNKDSTSADDSTIVLGSEALDRPKPAFSHPIPVIITTNATPQTSVVG